MTRRELIDYCLTYTAVYEDYPFDDMTDPGAWAVAELAAQCSWEVAARQSRGIAARRSRRGVVRRLHWLAAAYTARSNKSGMQQRPVVANGINIFLAEFHAKNT